jgi:hypothetical protein
MEHESPFHTDSPEYPPTHRNVYHDNSLCDHGKAIKQEHRVAGTGGRPRCERCDTLAGSEHDRPLLRVISAPFRVVGKLISKLVRSSD